MAVSHTARPETGAATASGASGSWGREACVAWPRCPVQRACRPGSTFSPLATLPLMLRCAHRVAWEASLAFSHASERGQDEE